MNINRSIKSGSFCALGLMLLLLCSCGGGKKKEDERQAAIRDSLSRPEHVKTVFALAKVEPFNGLVSLSAAKSGIVTHVYKDAGDSLQKGDLILRMDDQDEVLAVDLAKKEITIQQSRAAAEKANLLQYQAALKEKEQDLAVSERLVLTGAETRQNVSVKQKEKDVILANLQHAEALAAANATEVDASRKQLQQAQLALSDKVVRAKQNGVLVSMDAKVGTAINALTPYATYAPHGELILKGEIDEMFADRVKLGQPVVVNFVGNKQAIARGKIIYLSPVLEEKSLFYEKPGETSDRRVRQFKVSLDQQDKLLINSRVECTIQIQ